MTYTPQDPSLAPRLEPYALHLQGFADVVAYACASCGALFTTRMFAHYADAHQVASNHARTHCPALCGCGAALAGGQDFCAVCTLRQVALDEAQTFAEAEKVTAEAYGDGPLYCPALYQERTHRAFFINVEALLDACEEAEVDVPLFAWAVLTYPLEINALEALYTAIDALPEGHTCINPSTMGLQTLLDEWCDSENLETVEPDFTCAVLLHSQE